MLKRYIIKIPAVTKVDERASVTGASAAIAAASQLEYGNWARLVMAGNMILRHIIDV